MRIFARMKRYEPKQFPRMKGLSGISDALLPTERTKYVDAYFKNLDWRACEARLIK